MKSEISLDTVLSFGKYQGSSLREIMHMDLEYFEWLDCNTDFLFAEDVYTLYSSLSVPDTNGFTNE